MAGINEASSSSVASGSNETQHYQHYEAVKRTAALFFKIFSRLFLAGNDEVDAVSEMRDSGFILFPLKQPGDFPGICIGHEFYSRGEMDAIGFHTYEFERVDYISEHELKEYSDRYMFTMATSIVVQSMEYMEELEYVSNTNNADENSALKNNEVKKIPVRLIREHKSYNKSSGSGMIYTYDGLYDVVRICSKEDGSLIYRLNRREPQTVTMNQDPFLDEGHPFRDADLTGLCCQDISSADPERIPIIARNEVDYETFSSTGFRYSKSMEFAKDVVRPANTVRCDCEGTCSKSCPCTKLNKVYPYVSEEDSRLTKRKRVIYECGDHCGCGSRCRNKVTQHGLQLRLEIFRTGDERGWGVRCLDPIRIGTFIGEYIGEIRTDADAETDHDNMYFFDIDPSEKGKGTQAAKYVIDGKKVGNFVRFINHSCEPNLMVRSVLSENRDINFARIVLFAQDDIPAKEELTYYYGEGYVKKMECRCGAEDCRGRQM